MKKFLLVVLVGMVLTIDVFGIVKQFTTDNIEEIDHIEETTTTVYME